MSSNLWFWQSNRLKHKDIQFYCNARGAEKKWGIVIFKHLAPSPKMTWTMNYFSKLLPIHFLSINSLLQLYICSICTWDMMARVTAFMHIQSRQCGSLCLGTIQFFFFWLFLLGGPLNWTTLKYKNVPKKCRKAVVDTSTGNKSGRCGGGTRVTLATLRPAMTATLM